MLQCKLSKHYILFTIVYLYSRQKSTVNKKKVRFSGPVIQYIQSTLPFMQACRDHGLFKNINQLTWHLDHVKYPKYSIKAAMNFYFLLIFLDKSVYC